MPKSFSSSPSLSERDTMPLNLFPTTDTTLSKAKSLAAQPRTSHADKVLANRTEKHRIKMMVEESKPASDWLLEQFDKCQITVTNKSDSEGDYVWISVAPSARLYGGNHRQGLLSFREDYVQVGEDSEYVFRRTLGPDAYAMCYHTNEPGRVCPLEAQARIDGAERAQQERMLREQREQIQVATQNRRPRPIVLPVARSIREQFRADMELIPEATVETILWEPWVDHLGDLIIYRASYNGERFSWSISTEAWIHSTDAQLMRMLRDHTRSILANEPS